MLIARLHKKLEGVPGLGLRAGAFCDPGGHMGLKYNNLISHLGQWFPKWGPETSRGPAEGSAGGQSMYAERGNLISPLFISQRST